ncbi:uncharacterized protein B0H18DRAFT_1138762 [Fomitopsis serialis]|uniref:uncharacterized protein n=1 Tax=Fomitopsis serialis TaxID=139415 RepID=UPI002008790A|nr:uncharacterized protein B0H18DRAFT_1138762 [Neoantrodia serialis]KAH9916440.1 hypothetical protein B0H18DRAFT_1138762 [Neoantrodia serialis]
MAPHNKRGRVGLQNLGAYAQKRPRLAVDAGKENLEAAPGPELDTVLHELPKTPMEVYEDMRHTFAEITQPTWTAPTPSHSEPEHQPAFVSDSESGLMSSTEHASLGDSESEHAIAVESPIASVSEELEAIRAAQDSMNDSPRRPEKRPMFEPPPSVEEATVALRDLRELLHPRRKNEDAAGSLYPARVEQFWELDSCVSSDCCGLGIRAPPSKAAAQMDARFPAGPTCPSIQSNGEWTRSLLEKPDLKDALCEHLQTVGKYVRAMDIVEFMSDPEVLLRYGLKKPIGLSTAQAWMHALDYRWTKTPSGQYVDGHERADPLFGVDVDVIGQDGKPIYGVNGKKLQQRVRMSDGVLPNGQPQSLYFEEGSEKVGVFKGMEKILEERASGPRLLYAASSV